MKRPFGLTLLALYMFGLGVVGAVHTVLNLTQDADGVLVSRTNAVIFVAYGASAFVSAVGFWRMRPWGVRAFLTWAAVVAVLLAHMVFGPFRAMWMQCVAFGLIAAVLILFAARYARNAIAERG